MSIVISILWWQQPQNLDYFDDKLIVIFFVSTYVSLFFPAFKALFTFPSERAVILRERTSGSYRLSAYFIAKTLNEFVFMWEHPLLMIIITYFTVGMNLTPAAFFIFFGIALMSVWTSASLGLLVSAICGPDLNKAMTTMTLTAMVQFLTGGFFVQHFPYWITWLYYLSYIKYSIDAYLINELTGTIWTVSTNTTTSLTGISGLNVTGSTVSGDAILADYPIFIHDIGYNVLVILGYGILFRSLALGALQLTMEIPKQKNKTEE